MTKAYFISGVGTDVGKTVATTVLYRYFQRQGKKVAIVKPFQTGRDERTKRYPDLAWFEDYLQIEAFSYVTVPRPASPHFALKEQKESISLDTLVQQIRSVIETHDITLIEGAGGLAVPLYEEDGTYTMTTDFIRALQVPVILVNESGLGAIHDAVTTHIYAEKENLHIAALLFNRFDETDDLHRDTVETIVQLLRPPLYSVIPSFLTSKEMLTYKLPIRRDRDVKYRRKR